MYNEEQIEAVQHAVERVAANWDGATEGVVEMELRKAVHETQVPLREPEIASLARAIERNEGTVSAGAVLDEPK